MEAASAPGGRGSHSVPAGVLGAIFGVALLLRLSAIHDKFLWFDEFLTANLARNPWPKILGAVRAEAHPPLYFVLMKLWAAVFGDGRIALKSVSLLCGMAALALLADAVRRVSGPLAAAAAAIFFGLSTVQIDQSTDAKPYSMLVAFLALEIWGLVRARLEPERRGFSRLALLAAVAAGSTHFYGTAAAPAVGLADWLSASDPRGRRRGAAVVAAGAAVAFAWVPAAMRLPRGAADYIREIWSRVPAWAPLAASSRISLPGWRKPYPPMEGTVLPGLSAREIAAAILVAALLAWGAFGRRGAQDDRAGARFLLASGLVLSIGFLFLETAAGILDRPIGLPGRFEVVTATGLSLLAGWAAGRAGRRAGILAVLLASVCLWTVLPQWRPRFGPAPERREELIVEALRTRLPPGGVAEIVTLGLARPPFDYYAAGDPRLRLVSFPASQQDHPGWRESGITPDQARSLDAEADRLVASLDDDSSRGVRVFVAAREDPRNGFLLSRLRRNHDLVRSPLADWFYELVPSPVRVARAAGNLSGHPVSPMAKEALWDADGHGLPVY